LHRLIYLTWIGPDRVTPSGRKNAAVFLAHEIGRTERERGIKQRL